jgi:hypothetical protein
VSEFVLNGGVCTAELVLNGGACLERRGLFERRGFSWAQRCLQRQVHSVVRRSWLGFVLGKCFFVGPGRCSYFVGVGRCSPFSVVLVSAVVPRLLAALVFRPSQFVPAGPGPASVSSAAG